MCLYKKLVVRLIYILSKILKGIFWCNKKSLEWKNFICVCDENVKFSFFFFWEFMKHSSNWRIFCAFIFQIKDPSILAKFHFSQTIAPNYGRFPSIQSSIKITVWKKREVLYYQYTLVNYSVKLTFTKFLPKMHDNRDNFIFMELTFLSRVFL